MLELSMSLLFNEPATGQQRPEAGFLNKKLVLSRSFRCGQIHHCHIYESGHTLLCCLRLT
jgi:hypothetical protein